MEPHAVAGFTPDLLVDLLLRLLFSLASSLLCLTRPRKKRFLKPDRCLPWRGLAREQHISRLAKCEQKLEAARPDPDLKKERQEFVKIHPAQRRPHLGEQLGMADAWVLARDLPLFR